MEAGRTYYAWHYGIVGAARGTWVGSAISYNVLLDRDGADTVDPLVGMLARLWTGQVSRHGGGQRSREQTHAEAQAAVHLTATLVQLLGAGALTRRSTS